MSNVKDLYHLINYKLLKILQKFFRIVLKSKKFTALLLIATQTSPYTSTKPETQDLLYQMTDLGFQYRHHPSSQCFSFDFTHFSSKTI